MKLPFMYFRQKGIALFEVMVSQLLLGLFVFSFLKTQVFSIALADQSKQDFLAEFSAYQVIDLLNQSPYISELQLDLSKDSVSMEISCLDECENLNENHEKFLLLKSWLLKELGDFELAISKTDSQLDLSLFWFSNSPLNSDTVHSACDMNAESFNRCLNISWYIQ